MPPVKSKVRELKDLLATRYGAIVKNDDPLLIAMATFLMYDEDRQQEWRKELNTVSVGMNANSKATTKKLEAMITSFDESMKERSEAQIKEFAKKLAAMTNMLDEKHKKQADEAKDEMMMRAEKIVHAATEHVQSKYERMIKPLIIMTAASSLSALALAIVVVVFLVK